MGITIGLRELCGNNFGNLVHLKLCESREYPLTGIKGANSNLISYNRYMLTMEYNNIEW